MEEADKKKMSERDICSKFITPAIKQANWVDRQIREEVKLTNGRIIASLFQNQTMHIKEFAPEKACCANQTET
ncbi:hypothetical protein EO98_03360 [Methanosarcina sp. 2.H.T.1A.6]|uniref:hypothetical protein n=1 Tax=unclassified Methanosarcina TaxID=2644672 RepID=UPI000620F56C|nr:MULTISPECIES: hypothetical protein [unclassified Methanosarcina]KKG17524.1 hypothetical protein EO97_04880 [Methanosarcina sp. 2.H.T.1A.15]KKG18431.1 hypothetical protein EO94_04410 [Methanosarcina sp. 2.H.T.1A.3]KKG20632.1 hypothetical protein EO98_03360 [Methanosarcina sp. 2.H.T.1A.6]KKG23192.1 hypothetical protein EO96_01885 [Methanosarcina sp. 2.H.T.1A.8]